ncbi:hypothetical protein SAMN05444161_5572 [Rhizobiales bacterium GAS191]|nr:hypothetical protein SAMN05444161_5572 [Rhizobiales bacterium GAS191]
MKTDSEALAPLIAEVALGELARAYDAATTQLDSLALHVRMAQMAGEIQMVGTDILKAMHKAALALERLTIAIAASRSGAPMQYRN